MLQDLSSRAKFQFQSLTGIFVTYFEAFLSEQNSEICKSLKNYHDFFVQFGINEHC